MGNQNRIEIDPELLENINGGAIGYDPDSNGTYTMTCRFGGEVFYGITLSQVIQIAKYSANIPNTPEGEQQIIAWARGAGIIS